MADCISPFKTWKRNELWLWIFSNQGWIQPDLLVCVFIKLYQWFRVSKTFDQLCNLSVCLFDCLFACLFVRSPFSTARTPFSNAKTLFSNARTPFSNAKTLFSNARTPFSNAKTPFSNARTLFSNSKTLFANARTPFSNAKTLFSNAKTPFSKARTSFSNAKTSFSNGRTKSQNSVFKCQSSVFNSVFGLIYENSRSIDHLRNRLNFDLDKNFITAWKSITKLVIFQSFVAKCCKMRII